MAINEQRIPTMRGNQIRLIASGNALAMTDSQNLLKILNAAAAPIS
ncbi:MAG: hypothetical protein K2N54_07770 [Helicobacter sp.]|nr:hypothetical protein [Helicobacter sp.]